MKYEWEYNHTIQMVPHSSQENAKYYRKLLKQKHTLITDESGQSTNPPPRWMTSTSLTGMKWRQGRGKNTFILPPGNTLQANEPSTWTQQINTNSVNNSLSTPKAIKTKIPSKVNAQIASALWIVTDGGLYNSIGYFGWVIATDSDILFE